MNRRYQSVKGYSGIYRIEVFDSSTLKWESPRRGATFAADSYDSSGKRVRKHFYSFVDAKKYRQQEHRPRKESSIKSAVNSEPKTEGILFKDLIETWCKTWLPNKDISTQIRYRSYLKHFAFFKDMPVEAINPIVIDKWIAHVKAPEYLATTHSTRCSYKHEFSVLRGILNFYSSRFNRSYLLPFIKDHRSMIKVREKIKVNKDLTVDEFKKFLDELHGVCLENNCEVIFYLALMQYALYCRVQEAAAIQYEDFDFERNKVAIKRKVQWLRARGHQDRIVDGSKVNGGKELPSIPDLAAKVFREWILKSGVRSGLLFRIDDKVITYRQIEYRYTQALKRAGLPFRATHILRHASLTEHYAICKDVYATKEMAGHSDLRSTMKYVKARRETAIEAQKLMDVKISSVFGTVSKR